MIKPVKNRSLKFLPYHKDFHRPYLHTFISTASNQSFSEYESALVEWFAPKTLLKYQFSRINILSTKRAMKLLSTPFLTLHVLYVLLFYSVSLSGRFNFKSNGGYQSRGPLVVSATFSAKIFI